MMLSSFLLPSPPLPSLSLSSNLIVESPLHRKPPSVDVFVVVVVVVRAGVRREGGGREVRDDIKKLTKKWHYLDGTCFFQKLPPDE